MGFQDLILEAMSMKLSKFEISDAEYTINCKPRSIYAPPRVAPCGQGFKGTWLFGDEIFINRERYYPIFKESFLHSFIIQCNLLFDEDWQFKNRFSFLLSFKIKI